MHVPNTTLWRPRKLDGFEKKFLDTFGDALSTAIIRVAQKINCELQISSLAETYDTKIARVAQKDNL